MVLTDVDTLVEFRKGESSKPNKDEKPQQGKDRGVKGVKSQHHNGKEKAPQKKDGPNNGKKEAKCQHNCFLCDGDQWVRDCPKKMAFNAMFSETKEKQPEVPPAEAANMGCLKLFNALNAKQIPTKVQDKSLMHVVEY